MLEVSDFIPVLGETTKLLTQDYSKDTFPLVRIVAPVHLVLNSARRALS